MNRWRVTSWEVPARKSNRVRYSVGPGVASSSKYSIPVDQEAFLLELRAKIMRKVREAMAHATVAVTDASEAQVLELREQLKEAEADRDRALSGVLESKAYQEREEALRDLRKVSDELEKVKLEHDVLSDYIADRHADDRGNVKRVRELLQAWDKGELSLGEFECAVNDIYLVPFFKALESGEEVMRFGSCCCSAHPPNRTFHVKFTIEPHGYKAKRIESEQEIADTLADILADSDLPKEYIIGPTHSAWTSLDDDDWNGAALANLCTSTKDHLVILAPSPEHSRSTVERLCSAFDRNGNEVRIAWSTEP